MGCFGSTIYDARAVKRRRYKLLLLGTEDSGKSTLFRQIRQSVGLRYNHAELIAIKPRLIQDVKEAMRTLAIHTNKVSDGNEQILRRVSQMNNNVSIQDFATLLADPYIQKTMEIASQGNFDLNDSAPYLFENMHKYYDDYYIPTLTDLMHVSGEKTGIDRARFILRARYGCFEEIFDIFDVASVEKNAFGKWMHFFDKKFTTPMIFVASLSGYNEYILKDCDSVLVPGYIRECFDKYIPSELIFLIQRYHRMRQNKMKESIQLFRDIVKLKIFKDSFVILFLNKSDLFENKIGKYGVKEHFKEFEGSETKDDIIKFFIQKFRDQCTAGNTTIFFHITCVADTSCAQRVIDFCHDISLSNCEFL